MVDVWRACLCVLSLKYNIGGLSSVGVVLTNGSMGIKALNKSLNAVR